jgi:hypothetical protein
VSIRCATGKCSWTFVVRNVHFPVDNVVEGHRVQLHQDTDDTRLYIALRPSDDSPSCHTASVMSCQSHWFRARTECFSIQARRKQFFSELVHCGKKLTHPLVSTSLKPKLLSVQQSSCSVLHSTKTCPSIVTSQTLFADALTKREL